ncbi:MAG: putative rane protein [Frankiales bacterium]|nr:putative rane protein [Frankiales bacterium]
MAFREPPDAIVPTCSQRAEREPPSTVGWCHMTEHGTRRVDVGEPDIGSVVRRRLSVALGVRGLLALAFGVLALVWPGVTVLALALLFAVYAVVDGIGMVAGGLGAGRDRARRWSYVLAGVLGIVAGVLAALWPGVTALVLVLARPDVGALALATVLGIYALVVGVSLLAAAWQLRRAGVVVVDL